MMKMLNDIEQKDLEIIELITHNLDTQLIDPEEFIISQGDKGDHMYFI